MRNKKQIFAAILTILFSISAALADNSYEAAANALAAKMEKDLAIEKVQVKFSNVQSYDVSKSLIGLKGVGTANELPIQFDVKLNRTKMTPTLIKYNIVEALDSESLAQEKLTQNLLKKLSRDYKSNNVVIAIDYTDKESLSNNQTKISGSGEIRIGMEWRKIAFEVIESEQVNAPVAIKYKVE